MAILEMVESIAMLTVCAGHVRRAHVLPQSQARRAASGSLSAWGEQHHRQHHYDPPVSSYESTNPRFPTSYTMSHAPPPPPQWVLDLDATPASKPKNALLPDPPGYTASLTRKERALSAKTARLPPSPEEMDTLKMKKAWEVAIAPAKQLPMNAFGTSHADSTDCVA